MLLLLLVVFKSVVRLFLNAQWSNTDRVYSSLKFSMIGANGWGQLTIGANVRNSNNVRILTIGAIGATGANDM